MNTPLINLDQFVAATGQNQVLWQIADEVAALARISADELFGRSRRRKIARARQFAMWAARQHGMSFSEIGSFFDRDHTTVMHACRAVEARMWAFASTTDQEGDDTWQAL
jgi:chromosomal replication initiator protein